MESKFKPKIKEVWRKDETIKISTLLEVTENPKGSFTNKEKLINVKINRWSLETSQSFPCTKKGKRDLLKFISEECYLK